MKFTLDYLKHFCDVEAQEKWDRQNRLKNLVMRIIFKGQEKRNKGHKLVDFLNLFKGKTHPIK